MNPPSWSKPGTSYARVVRGETNSSDSDQDGKDQFAVSPPSWLQTFQTVGEDEAVKIALAKSLLVGIMIYNWQTVSFCYIYLLHLRFIIIFRSFHFVLGESQQRN